MNDNSTTDPGTPGNYATIKADAAAVSGGLDQTVKWLQRQYSACDFGEPDSDWEVCLNPDAARRLIASLEVVHGFVSHLAHKPEAAKALADQHDGG